MLDPATITITGGSGDGAADGTATFQGNATAGTIIFTDASPTTVYESEIEGLNADIVLQASQTITTSGTFGSAQVLLQNNRNLTLQTRNQVGDGAGGINLTASADGVGLEFKTQGAGTITITGSTDGGAAGNVTVGKLTTASGALNITSNGTGSVALNGALTTAGGQVQVTSGSNITSSAAGTITTTAAADSGTGSGAVQINATGTGTISLTGAIDTTGASNTLAAASAGGQVDLTTADGAITVGTITTSGGAGVGQAGGNAAGINITTGGSAKAITINGALTALGGNGNGVAFFRSASSAGAASGVLSLIITTPAGTVQNDVLIATVGFRPSTAVITAPAGWTLIRRIDNAVVPANSLAVYRKTAGAGEPANYTWTFDTSTGSSGGIQSFGGVDTTTPINIELGQTTPSALTHATPSITTTVGNTMVVTAHAFSSAASWTPPAGMTEAFDVASVAVPFGGEHSMEGNFVFQAAAGATGVKTATASNDLDGGNTHILALQSGTAAGGTVTLTATGAITQSGVIAGTTLTTNSVGGTTLAGAITVTGFTATNATSGNISLITRPGL